MESLLMWIITALFSIVMTGGGFLMRRLFKKQDETDKEVRVLRADLNKEVSELKGNYTTRFQKASDHRHEIKVDLIEAIGEIKVMIAEKI